MPRLAGESAVAQAVNAALATVDARALATLSCAKDRPSEDASRSVDVISDGPEFPSFVISSGGWCAGAAHPWWQQDIVSFDLQTGQETDLREFLPPWFKTKQDRNALLQVLFLNNVADLPGDCAATYALNIRDGYLGLDLGLGEASGALMLCPMDGSLLRFRQGIDGMACDPGPAFVPERLR